MAAAAVLPQSRRFGVKGGVPLTRYFDTGSTSFPLRLVDSYSAATRRYTAGLTGEWWLRPRLAAGAEVLYHRMGYVAFERTFSAGVTTISSYDVKGHSWDVPLFAKYRLLEGRWRPFALGGVVLRYAGPVRARGERFVQDLPARTESRTPIDTNEPAELSRRLYPGLTFGGGLELHGGRVSVGPELRYARWLANLSGRDLRFPSNQVEVLLGVVF